jgi:hypothetical protein
LACALVDNNAFASRRCTLQEKRVAGASAAAADAKENEGFFKAYLETILGNLQLSITNVHVRFEGELPSAGADGSAARFAAGITLQELSAITTDSAGSEAFESKVCVLFVCCMYLLGNTHLQNAFITSGSRVAAAQARDAQTAGHLLRPIGAATLLGSCVACSVLYAPGHNPYLTMLHHSRHCRCCRTRRCGAR